MSDRQDKQKKLFIELGTLYRLKHLLADFMSSPRHTELHIVDQGFNNVCYENITDSISKLSKELAAMKAETAAAKRKIPHD